MQCNILARENSILQRDLEAVTSESRDRAIILAKQNTIDQDAGRTNADNINICVHIIYTVYNMYKKSNNRYALPII